jgi:putative redox protein
MVLNATARSIRGTLRQDIEIDGRHHVVTDEPERSGGDGSGPSPHELLPAALAGCISTHVVMYARTKEWELGDVTVAVDYDPGAAPRRFDVEIRLGADVGPEQLERLRKVAVGCPVRRALEGTVVFEQELRGSTGAGGPASRQSLVHGYNDHATAD